MNRPITPEEILDVLPEALKSRFRGYDVKFLIPELFLDPKYYEGPDAPLEKGRVYLTAARGGGDCVDIVYGTPLIDVTGVNRGNLKEFRKKVEKDLGDNL